MSGKLGDVLSREGYAATSRWTLLHDLDADRLYLGGEPTLRCKPDDEPDHRAYAGMPLFPFHLLEYMDVDCRLDIRTINSRWEQGCSGTKVWDQLIGTLRRTSSSSPRPRTGMWRLNR